jgi:hypothetical protein
VGRFPFLAGALKNQLTSRTTSVVERSYLSGIAAAAWDVTRNPFVALRRAEDLAIAYNRPTGILCHSANARQLTRSLLHLILSLRFRKLLCFGRRNQSGENSSYRCTVHCCSPYGLRWNGAICRVFEPKVATCRSLMLPLFHLFVLFSRALMESSLVSQSPQLIPPTNPSAR